MENVTDALYMAASVLLLIVALSVSMSSFTRLKEQADDIVKSSEKTDLATDGSGNYLNYITNSDDVRTVDAGTVVSSIRRVFKESYTIILSGTIANTVNGDPKYKDIVSTLERPQLYKGTPIISTGQNVIKISIDSSNYKLITDDKSTEIVDENFMEYIENVMKEKTFKEYIGIYEKADVTENVSSANKETYRVITFVQI